MKSLSTSDHKPKSLALRLAGLCIGLAAVVITNALPGYKAQIEMALLTAAICLFFVYDFWGLRKQQGFRAGVIVAGALHATILIAVWQVLPIHLLVVLGIACIERFAVMLVCFKFMERES